MNCSALCSVLLTLGFILISQSPLQTNARADHLIGKVCKRYKDAIKCANTLRADPKILHANNYFEVSKGVLELGLKEGIKGQKFLEGLVKAKYTPAIAECAKNYSSTVIKLFKRSFFELTEDNIEDSYRDVQTASDVPVNCQRGLFAAHIHNPAINALNHKISLICYVAYRTINGIIGG